MLSKYEGGDNRGITPYDSLDGDTVSLVMAHYPIGRILGIIGNFIVEICFSFRIVETHL